MAAWPSGIPGPIVNDVALSRGATFVRTNMAAGPARQRRTSSQAPDRVDIRAVFDKVEFGVFEGWFKHEIDDGAAWFDLVIPAAGQQVSVDARFVGEQSPYSVKTSVDRSGTSRFEVSAALEVRARPVMTPAEIAPYL